MARKPQPASDGREESLPADLAGMTGRGAIPVEDFNALSELLHPGDKKRDIDARSQVTQLQLIQFARGRRMAAHYWKNRKGGAALDSFIDDILKLSLSLDRQSRKEFVKSFQASQGNDSEGGVFARMREGLRS